MTENIFRSINTERVSNYVLQNTTLIVSFYTLYYFIVLHVLLFLLGFTNVHSSQHLLTLLQTKSSFLAENEINAEHSKW